MNKDKNEIEELIELKNKLTNGMVFKSYRALCENMGLKKGDGNTRRANMKKLDAICTYHKQGNSIVIDEVFDAPLLIEDNRKGKQPSIANEGIQLAILYLLSEARCIIGCDDRVISNKCEIVISKGKLMWITGMVNGAFSHYMYNQDEIKDIDSGLVAEYFDKTIKNLSGYLDRALKSLVNKALIFCSKDIVYVYKDGFSRPSTYEDRQLILMCKREELEERGLKDESEIGWYKKKDFKSSVLKRIENYGSSIKNYYTVYQITGNKKFIPQEYKELSNKITYICKKDINMELSKIIFKLMQKSKDDYLLLDDEEYDDNINKLIEKTIYKDWDTIEEDLANIHL